MKSNPKDISQEGYNAIVGAELGLLKQSKITIINIKSMKQYQLVSWNEISKYPKQIGDTIYCGLYNGEPSVIRIENNEPVFVQFIDNNRIFDKKGILLSSIELLLKLNK